jgi:Spy/CpxP family protein refolding chaperone
MSKNRIQWQQIAKFLQEQRRNRIVPPDVSKRTKLHRALSLVIRSAKWKGAA